jgi:hypothetical protein
MCSSEQLTGSQRHRNAEGDPDQEQDDQRPGAGHLLIML